MKRKGVVIPAEVIANVGRFCQRLTRSLVVKIYLFAITALVVLGVLSFFAGRLLVDQARIDAFREFRMGQAISFAKDVERLYATGGLSPYRVGQVAAMKGARARLLPWKQALAAQPRLAHDSVVWEPSRVLGPWCYWIKVEHAGQPFGALRVVNRRPLFRHAHRPWVTAAVVMLVVGLMAVPPLVMWVVMPLRRMAGVANRLGLGRLDEPVNVSGPDEFGKLEEAFETLRVRILQMLDQRDRLLTDISHELRGPLSRIAVAVPLVRAGLDPKHPARPYLAQIAHEASKMDDLIGELLDFARAKNHPTQALDLVDLAVVVQALIADRTILASEKQQSLALTLAPAPVRGEAKLLTRAVGNLVDNALKYVPFGGQITIDTRIEGDESCCRVRDDGPGISQTEIPHIFEPFYRPDSARTRETGGTGLGLAIVRSVAESHRGRVEIRSEAGQGTVAELRLPAAIG